MVKCPVCGAENPETAVACQTCGQRLGLVQAATAQQMYPIAQPPMKNNKLVLMIVGIVIAVLVIVGVAVAYSLSKTPGLEITDADAVIYPDGEVRFTVTVGNPGDSEESATLVCMAKRSDLDTEYTKDTVINVPGGEERTYFVSVDVPSSWWAYEVLWQCWIE